MATRREVGAVYDAALLQGAALITFPAASSILNGPDDDARRQDQATG